MIGYDYTDRIDPAALVGAGCEVVFRYLSNPGWPKNLTGPEARELLASGRKIVLNYETTATFMLGGYSAGVTCARSARQQANDLGAPSAAKIFYSADFDASPSQTSVLMDFLRGAASVDGSAQVGLYGGLRAVQAAASAGYATWQTIAWSGGQWDSRAAARQTGQQRNVGGAAVDVNEIINLAGLGAWGGPTFGGTMSDGNIPPAISATWPPLAGTFPAGSPYTTADQAVWANAGARAAGIQVAALDRKVDQVRTDLGAKLDQLLARPSAPPVDLAALEAFIVEHQTAGTAAADFAAALIGHLDLKLSAK